MRILLIALALLSSAAAAQNGSGKNPASALNPPFTPSLHNDRYTITFPNTTQSWNIAGNRVTSTQVSQALAADLVRRLSQQGLVQVKSLDVQCCNIELRVIGAAARESSTHEPRFSLMVRVTVVDVDGQFIYGKQYSAQAPAGPGQVGAAAAELGKAVTADTSLLKALVHR